MQIVFKIDKSSADNDLYFNFTELSKKDAEYLLTYCVVPVIKEYFYDEQKKKSKEEQR